MNLISNNIIDNVPTITIPNDSVAVFAQELAYPRGFDRALARRGASVLLVVAGRLAWARRLIAQGILAFIFAALAATAGK